MTSAFSITRPDDLIRLLQLHGKNAHNLRREALKEKERVFGNKVFVRGVIEVSNYCRENCNYCGMRRENRSLKRFRISRDRIIEIISQGLPKIVTDLNFQAGEDPRVIEEIILPVIHYVRAHTSLGVSLCLGTLSSSHYAALQSAGASYYIIKLETTDTDHYRRLSAPGTLEERLRAVQELAESGWNVSSGIILGLPGQTLEMVAAAIQFLRSLPLAGVSVSPFIPGEETPLSGEKPPDPEAVLNAVAILRLANPDRILPAVSAMNLLGEDQYVEALRSGANLVTMNLTPEKQQADYLLYAKRRFIMNQRRIENALRQAGGEASTISLAEFLSQNRPEAVQPVENLS